MIRFYKGGGPMLRLSTLKLIKKSVVIYIQSMMNLIQLITFIMKNKLQPRSYR